MHAQITDIDLKDAFSAVSGEQCKYCKTVIELGDNFSHLVNCEEFIRQSKLTKKFDMSIQANKTYPGKLIVQDGTEDEMIQGIKEILKIHSSERHHTRINIWNHSIAEKSEEELGEKYDMKSVYHLVDRDDREPYSIFKSVLDCDTIRQIEEEATIEFQKENSNYKTEIFFEILAKKDPNYEIVENIQDIDI